MYAGYREEGDQCPEKDCKGILAFIRKGDCSCHLHPPCRNCMNAPLSCPICGWEDESEPEVYVPLAPGLSMVGHKPKPLDPTKIDWRDKLHTASSMIKEGVYPEGTTRSQVEEKVKGTFGGRFEYFGNGKFKYIAYTD